MANISGSSVSIMTKQISNFANDYWGVSIIYLVKLNSFQNRRKDDQRWKSNAAKRKIWNNVQRRTTMTCKMILESVDVTKYLGTLSSGAVVRRSVRGLRGIIHRLPGYVGHLPRNFDHCHPPRFCSRRRRSWGCHCRAPPPTIERGRSRRGLDSGMVGR